MNRQVSGVTITEQKFAEKLVILTERGNGILIRLYNIKKACQDPQNRPSFLSEKALEPAIKHLVKRFPVAETKGASQLQSLQPLQKDLMAALQNSYHTFVDLMEFRDVAMELVTAMASNNIVLDIGLNFGITKLVLDLIVLYCNLMLMLSLIDDRRALVALYNHAYDLNRGSGENSYPRLSQMIVDYDNPVKKFSEDFGAISQFFFRALISLTKLYVRRSLPAEQLRSQQTLSVTHAPNLMLQPTLSNEMASEFLSMERVNRWILVGFLTCANRLSEPGAFDLVKLALQDGYVVTVCRDETLLIHAAYEQILSASPHKNERKKVAEVQEMTLQAVQQAPSLHRDKRRFLRSCLNELNVLLSDAPGLLGPKMVTVLTGMVMARDEIHWLYRHANTPPPKTKHKTNPADYQDLKLPELIFQLVELRNLVLRHRKVVQNYYRKYLGNYHAAYLRDLAQRIPMAPELESVLMSSFVDTLMRMGGKEGESTKEFDLTPLRLDWLRMQTYTSTSRSSMKITEHIQFVVAMNTIVTHSTFVDQLDMVLKEHVGMSFAGFYSKSLEAEFGRCMAADDEACKFAASLASVYSDFLDGTCSHAPEERVTMGEKAVNMVHQFLETMAKEIRTLTQRICEERIKLSSCLIAVRGSAHYIVSHSDKTRQKDKKNLPQVVIPGQESERKDRGEPTGKDLLMQKLIHLCWSMNHYPTISVWEHTFRPREYLTPHLEDIFITMAVAQVNYQEVGDQITIARPSEALHKLRALVAAVRIVETYVSIDLTHELTQVLLQQTQPTDSKGGNTIAVLYANWYVNVMLRRASQGGILYSPCRKTFISRANSPFKAEEYSDISELMALAELIGPYGIRLVGEKLMEQISSQTKEIKRLVVANRDTLLSMLQNKDKPELFQEAARKLRNTDDLLTRMSIVGIVMSFRRLTLEALHAILSRRTPFLVSAIERFHENPPAEHPEVTEDIAAAAGVNCSVDPLLTRIMTLHCDRSAEDLTTWTLLFIYIGAALPEFAFKPDSVYIPALEAHENNAHCLPIAVNTIGGSVFSFYGGHHQREKMKEFLVFTSSRLMKLGQEVEKEKEYPRQREAIYLLLDLLVHTSPFVTMDQLEHCFPYALLRDSYSQVYRKPPMTKKTAQQEVY